MQFGMCGGHLERNLWTCCFVCPCLIPEVLHSILGNGSLPLLFFPTVERSRSSALGVIKDSFPGWSSFTSRWRYCGIFHVERTMGTMEGVLIAPCSIVRMVIVRPSRYHSKRTQVPAQTLFLSLHLPYTHILIDPEPNVSVPTLLFFHPYSFSAS